MNKSVAYLGNVWIELYMGKGATKCNSRNEILPPTDSLYDARIEILRMFNSPRF